MDIISIISLGLTTMGVGGGGIFALIKSYRKNRIYVRQITKSADKDIDPFIELYEKVIHQNMRISPEEILEWIPERNKSSKQKHIIHFLFVCKHANKVVGFLKSIYCKESKFLFIAYLGIDKSEYNARFASKCLLNELEKYRKNKFPECKALFCEAQFLPKIDNTQDEVAMSAKIRLFKEIVKKRGLTAYEVDMKYIQPEIPNDYHSSTKEEQLVLLYCPFKSHEIDYISKKDLMEGIRFIYTKIYGPTYRNDKEMDELYQTYLKEKLITYETTLPAKIRLIK